MKNLRKLILEAQPDKENLRKETTDNIVLDGKMLNAFFLRSRTRRGYLLSPCLFLIVLEIIDKARKINKRNKEDCLYPETIYGLYTKPPKPTKKKSTKKRAATTEFSKFSK